MDELRIIVAEDEAIIRADLREILQEHGCKVVGEAHDGIEALALTRAHRPDCVMMDIQMNGHDGLDAARVICDEGISAVVIVSAFSQEGLVHAAADAGVMAYLNKPFSNADIMSTLHVALSRFEQTKILAGQVDDLQERLETRKLTERAKGILMQGGLDEPTAFSRLQRMAMNERRSLKDVAEAVIMSDKMQNL
jgi:response regulator NasT